MPDRAALKEVRTHVMRRFRSKQDSQPTQSLTHRHPPRKAAKSTRDKGKDPTTNRDLGIRTLKSAKQSPRKTRRPTRQGPDHFTPQRKSEITSTAYDEEEPVIHWKVNLDHERIDAVRCYPIEIKPYMHKLVVHCMFVSICILFYYNTLFPYYFSFRTHEHCITYSSDYGLILSGICKLESLARIEYRQSHSCPVNKIFMFYPINDTKANTQTGAVSSFRDQGLLPLEFNGGPTVSTENTWISMALKSATIFHSLLFVAALHYSLLHGSRDMATKAQTHKVTALRLINEKMKDPVNAVADENITAVITMAMFEVLLGNQGAWDCHMKGVAEMIKVRGGLEALQDNSFLSQYIPW